MGSFLLYWFMLLVLCKFHNKVMFDFCYLLYLFAIILSVPCNQRPLGTHLQLNTGFLQVVVGETAHQWGTVQQFSKEA